ncbi:MAG: fused MFS/spermidine synthase [Planctomycetia bacterium]|nr:fused MFS/spermidine synthase [Planctomycetia bacterium]
MAGYAAAILLSSFLLFQVQPLIGKYILPWFGGTPAVWTTCMLSFQVFLLAGYGYAHWLAGRLTLRRQGLLHLVLLAASLLFLPIIPADTWKPYGDEWPTWRILCLLGASIGAPYLLLSSTGPLLQSWFARTNAGRSPYRLYALSNAGSLAALVTYPFVFEPALRLGGQAWTWSACYGVFAVLCGACAVRVCRFRGSEMPADAIAATGAGAEDPPVEPPGRMNQFLWLALAACGSVVLLATTGLMCQEVAVVPFLWVLPLALYLLTFIIAFDNERWYNRAVFGVLMVAGIAGATAVLYVGVSAPLWVQVAVYSGTLFVCCMVCHGEMVRLKPHPRYLTKFYLMIAAGGALGGVLATLVAPAVFTSFWEYHLSLVACCGLLLVTIFRDRTWGLYAGRPLWAWFGLAYVFAMLTGALAYQAIVDSRQALVKTRSFYGMLQIDEYSGGDNGPYYSLRHGRIMHGVQYLDEEKRRWPTSYYGPETGVGLAVRWHPRRWIDEPDEGALRIGVIGLGTGTMAAHGKPGDVIRFYEINPDVIRLSSEYFTYRRDSAARVDVVLGDARISLERSLREQGSEQFDVLVVDAFSSDAIPMHLLTRECFEVYWKHLKPDGILAVHISNRNLDLGPVARGLAAEFGHEAALFDTSDDDARGVDAADWVLVTANREFLDRAEIRDARSPWPDDARPPLVWTDDFSNLFAVLRW